MEPNKHNSIAENVAEAIKAGKLEMHSRRYFLAKTILFTIGFLIMLGSVMFLTSFIIFVLRQTGAWFAPGFGFAGVRIFLMSLPWMLVILLLGCIALSEKLMNRYAFAYRRPMLYSLAGLTISVVTGGIIVSRTPLHARFYENANNDRLPIAGSLYRRFPEQAIHNVHPGVIIKISDGGFQMATKMNEQIMVNIGPDVRISRSIALLVGNEVIVFGSRASSTIIAEAIRVFENGDDGFVRKPGMKMFLEMNREVHP